MRLMKQPTIKHYPLLALRNKPFSEKKKEKNIAKNLTLPGKK